MAFRIKPALQLKTMVDMIQDLILTPTRVRDTWTQESLQKYLSDVGFEFTDAEIDRINGELHTRGIVEDI